MRRPRAMRAPASRPRRRSRRGAGFPGPRDMRPPPAKGNPPSRAFYGPRGDGMTSRVAPGGGSERGALPPSACGLTPRSILQAKGAGPALWCRYRIGQETGAAELAGKGGRRGRRRGPGAARCADGRRATRRVGRGERGRGAGPGSGRRRVRRFVLMAAVGKGGVPRGQGRQPQTGQGQTRHGQGAIGRRACANIHGRMGHGRTGHVRTGHGRMGHGQAGPGCVRAGARGIRGNRLSPAVPIAPGSNWWRPASGGGRGMRPTGSGWASLSL